MATITFYPLGNADCYRVDLPGGEKILFDYADMRCADDPADVRVDLPGLLRDDLDVSMRDGYDVVAFTHFDRDHVLGAGAFFEFRHAKAYTGGRRAKIDDLWVPAWALTEDRADLCDDGKLLQAEARYRLVTENAGVRVFSRPERLRAWLAARGVTLESRAHLITDAGTCVPGWSTAAQGIEFFVHSPFATRQNDGAFDDRNTNSLVLQVVIVSGGRESRLLLMGDTEHECLSEIVRVTRDHGRDERLRWDLVKLPHHSSYLSLGPDKGADKTVPVADVAWLYEQQGQRGGRLVSTSDPIPKAGTQIQPPHRQAANYYRGVIDALRGAFFVTMEHPSAAAPAPLVVDVDGFGVTPRKSSAPVGGLAVSRPAPRAG